MNLVKVKLMMLDGDDFATSLSRDEYIAETPGRVDAGEAWDDDHAEVLWRKEPDRQLTFVIERLKAIADIYSDQSRCDESHLISQAVTWLKEFLP